MKNKRLSVSLSDTDQQALDIIKKEISCKNNALAIKYAITCAIIFLGMKKAKNKLSNKE